MLAGERHWHGDVRVYSRLEDRGLDQRLRRRPLFLAGIPTLRPKWQRNFKRKKEGKSRAGSSSGASGKSLPDDVHVDS